MLYSELSNQLGAEIELPCLVAQDRNEPSTSSLYRNGSLRLGLLKILPLKTLGCATVEERNRIQKILESASEKFGVEGRPLTDLDLDELNKVRQECINHSKDARRMYYRFLNLLGRTLKITTLGPTMARRIQLLNGDLSTPNPKRKKKLFSDDMNMRNIHLTPRQRKLPINILEGYEYVCRKILNHRTPPSADDFLVLHKFRERCQNHSSVAIEKLHELILRISQKFRIDVMAKLNSMRSTPFGRIESNEQNDGEMEPSSVLPTDELMRRISEQIAAKGSLNNTMDLHSELFKKEADYEIASYTNAAASERPSTSSCYDRIIEHASIATELVNQFRQKIATMSTKRTAVEYQNESEEEVRRVLNRQCETIVKTVNRTEELSFPCEHSWHKSDKSSYSTSQPSNSIDKETVATSGGSRNLTLREILSSPCSIPVLNEAAELPKNSQQSHLDLTNSAEDSEREHSQQSTTPDSSSNGSPIINHKRLSSARVEAIENLRILKVDWNAQIRKAAERWIEILSEDDVIDEELFSSIVCEMITCKHPDDLLHDKQYGEILRNSLKKRVMRATPKNGNRNHEVFVKQEQ